MSFPLRPGPVGLAPMPRISETRVLASCTRSDLGGPHFSDLRARLTGSIRRGCSKTVFMRAPRRACPTSRFRMPPRASSFSLSRIALAEVAGCPLRGVPRTTAWAWRHSRLGSTGWMGAWLCRPLAIAALTISTLRATGYAAAAFVAGSPDSRRRPASGG